ncbi:MAG: M24 family metallopeptidase [Actinobacteria bacterium]|uniref:Unannotated protein n=1 Tax=freshwater metagenome TaxID=449393 RepID=A0A6J6WKF4_9ZZZZ|nr:M24 family metallopeptidase [Actinomycetota bacterium]
MSRNLSLFEYDRRATQWAAVLDQRDWTYLVLPIGRDDSWLSHVAGRPLHIEAHCGVVLVRRGLAPALLVEPEARWPEDTGWLTVERVADLATTLRQFSDGRKAGIVGRFGSELALAAIQKSGVRTEDATQDLLATRELKGDEELHACEHAAWIIDRCFERLLHRVKPGDTAAHIAAAVHADALDIGASACEVLMFRWVTSASGARLAVDLPGDEVVHVGGTLLCSIRVAAASGHSALMARPVVFGMPNEPIERAARGAGSALAAIVRHARPGVAIGSLESIATVAAESEGATLLSARIHGIGLDTCEAPTGAGALIQQGHILVVECACSADTMAASLQACTLIVEHEAARRLDSMALGLFAPELHRPA